VSDTKIDIKALQKKFLKLKKDILSDNLDNSRFFILKENEKKSNKE